LKTGQINKFGINSTLSRPTAVTSPRLTRLTWAKAASRHRSCT